MKTRFTVLSILIATLGFAQPTITSSMTPSIGDNITLYHADTTNATPGSGGANIIWDFTGLTGLGTSLVQSEVAPSSTKNGSLYSNSTFADTNTITPSVTYHHADNNGLYTDGYVTMLSLVGETVVNYDADPEKILSFPFTYSNTFTDNYNGTLTFALGSYAASGSVTVEADGYGTLKLPNITLTNVLRVKRVENVSTVNIPGLGVVTSNTEIYDFYAVGTSNYPVLSFVYTNFNNTPTREIFSAYPFNPVGINDDINSEEEIVDFKVYPNPVNNILNLATEINHLESVRVVIYDQSGNKVNDMPWNLVPGNNTKTIDVTSLSSGLYYIEFIRNDQIDADVFIKN